MRRLAQPVKKPFDRITCEENLENVSTLFGQEVKALSDGGGKVSNLPGAHAIDSK